MRVTIKLLVIGMCLSCLVLLGACGSKSTGTASPTPSPARTLTIKRQAAAYFKAMRPVIVAEKALAKKLAKFQGQLDIASAFSVAAMIKDSYLPAMQQIKAMLAAIKPPPWFRVAHSRLEKVCVDQSDFLYFLRDAIRRAIYTRTVEPGFSAKASRYLSRLRRDIHEFGIAFRAAAKRSHVKAPSRLLN